jgi:hypothetical protein
MEAAGGYVKEIWVVSGWAMEWQVKTVVLYVYVDGCLLIHKLKERRQPPINTFYTSLRRGDNHL